MPQDRVMYLLRSQGSGCRVEKEGLRVWTVPMCWRCRRELISCLQLGVWKLILLEVFRCVPCLSK